MSPAVQELFMARMAPMLMASALVVDATGCR
jgi:hypothetical protein